ncbi:MAG: glycosyltransferase family 2 protein [Nocardioides sp.]
MNSTVKPMLSVIVPARNAARTLAATLDSICAQTHTDFEVLVVDDFSTDHTPGIVLDHPDDRVRLITRPRNGGIAAARNTGLDQAVGDFITFVDADDDLPAGAWQLMLTTLARSGSDLVTGSVARLADGHSRVPPLTAEIHAERRLGITLSDLPLLLADVFAWNKVYRRKVWQHRRFPETRYEDQAALTGVWLEVDRVDVIPEVVYRWHRHVGSASERRWELSDLTDRFATKRQALAEVRRARPDLVDLMLDRVLINDVSAYFRTAVGDRTQPSYWPTLVSGVQDLWTDRRIWETHLPKRQKLMGWFVAADRPRDLARMIELTDTGRFVKPHPWADDPQLPRRLRHIGLDPHSTADPSRPT